MVNVPELKSPFPFQVNAHLERTRTHLNDWVTRTGLVRRPSAMARFEQADFGWFVALVYPTADQRCLDLVADWFGWLFLVDDQLDDGSAGRDARKLRAAIDEMRAVLTGAEPAGVSTRSPAVDALSDLWSRTTCSATSRWRTRFADHLERCLLTAVSWEADNRVRGIVPEEQEYVAKRRHTGAIYVCMDLIEIVEGIAVGDDVHDDPRFRDALDAACNVVVWTNDLFSLEKERSLDEVHNFVWVVQHHRGLDEKAALECVRDAIDSETARFTDLATELERAFRGEPVPVQRYLAGMRSWMRGNLDWSMSTRRYRSRPDGRPRFEPAEYLESVLPGRRS